MNAFQIRKYSTSTFRFTLVKATPPKGNHDQHIILQQLKNSVKG